MNKKRLLIPVILFTIVIIILVNFLSRDYEYEDIVVSNNTWENIINNKIESNKLVLNEIKFNDYNLMIDENSNTLYYSLINESKTKYTPNVSFKANEVNVKIAILSDMITDEKIRNNHTFKVMIYSQNLYHIYDLICTDFPILNISYKSNTVNNRSGILVRVYIFDNLSKIPNRISISNGNLRKKESSYYLSLNMTTPGKNIRENSISLFNMKPASEYILNEASSEEKSIFKTNHRVALFINGEYKGIYLLEQMNGKEKI